jgi:hypothetical protein
LGTTELQRVSKRFCHAWNVRQRTSLAHSARVASSAWISCFLLLIAFLVCLTWSAMLQLRLGLAVVVSLWWGKGVEEVS